MRRYLTKDLCVTEVFYKRKVFHVVDSCTVRRCILAILDNLNVTGAAYLIDRDGPLLPGRMLSTARGDVRIFVLAQREAENSFAGTTKIVSKQNSPEKIVEIAFGDHTWTTPSSYQVDMVLQMIISFCSCNNSSVLYLTDRAGPVAPSLTLSSTFGKLILVLEKDEEHLERRSATVRMREGIEIPEFRLQPPATSANTTPRRGGSWYNFLKRCVPKDTGQTRINARLWALFFPPRVIVPTSQLRRILNANIAEGNAGNARIIQHRHQQKGSAWSFSATARNTAANATIKDNRKPSGTSSGRSWWGRGKASDKRETNASEERESPLSPVDVNVQEDSEGPQKRGVRFAEVVQ